MSAEDPLAPDLRAALRSLAEDTPNNNLARASLLAAVAGTPLEDVARAFEFDRARGYDKPRGERAEEQRRLFATLTEGDIAMLKMAARQRVQYLDYQPDEDDQS